MLKTLVLEVLVSCPSGPSGNLIRSVNQDSAITMASSSVTIIGPRGASVSDRAESPKTCTCSNHHFQNPHSPVKLFWSMNSRLPGNNGSGWRRRSGWCRRRPKVRRPKVRKVTNFRTLASIYKHIFERIFYV